jgi:predicted nucleotidyltransferase
MSPDIPASVLERLLSVVNSESSVSQLWLFGSRARGDNRTNSDIDILLIGDNIPRSINTKLRESAGLYKLDILRPEEINNETVSNEINKDKVLLFDREVSSTRITLSV